MAELLFTNSVIRGALDTLAHTICIVVTEVLLALLVPVCHLDVLVPFFAGPVVRWSVA